MVETELKVLGDRRFEVDGLVVIEMRVLIETTEVACSGFAKRKFLCE